MVASVTSIHLILRADSSCRPSHPKYSQNHLMHGESRSGTSCLLKAIHEPVSSNGR
jgi:hypothetical protein